MAWKGRQLTGHTKDGVTSTFRYDADGLRASKTVSGVNTTYQYVGDQLFYEKRGDNQEFYYFYDSYGNLSKIYYTFIYGETTSRAIYHTLTNAQGDVIALYNNSGSLVAQYEYDAWGNTLSVTDASGNEITAWYNIANANPIRYRGYYYDSDLGLYYLQSRYYDATIGRFINADKYISTGQDILGYNMFAYCSNNSVVNSDSSGKNYERARSIDNESANSIFGLFITAVVALIICRLYPTATRALPRYSTQRYSSPSISIPKEKEEAEPKTIPKTPPKDPVHHIVAKADHRAAESRQILIEVGINPLTDPVNLVTLPQSYHFSLHTTAYHNYVTERLRSVAGDKEGVEATLASIKEELRVRSATGIRWD